MKGWHGSYRRRPLRWVTLFMTSVALLLSVAPAAAQSRVVTISGFAFQPQSLSVQLGDTVTWHNSDAASHTATADGGKWGTSAIASGGNSAPILMDAVGAFPYHCAIHPGMTGTIVVLGAATPVPSTPAPAPVPTATPTAVPTAPPTPGQTTAATGAPAASQPAAASPAANPSPSAAASPGPAVSASPDAAASLTATVGPSTRPRSATPLDRAPPIPSGPGSLFAGIAVAVAGVLAGLAWLLFRRR